MISPVPLARILALCGAAETRGDLSIGIEGITHRSDRVKNGFLFACFKGTRADGHDFVTSARNAGAVAILCERWVDGLDCPQVRVQDVRSKLGPIAAVLFGHPGRKMTLLGVTGTYGKTTTTLLIGGVIRAAGIADGVLGTLGAAVKGVRWPLDTTTVTTPEATELHAVLSQMTNRGVEVVAMEVTAQALEQYRVEGLQFDCAVFTNLYSIDDREHMERYRSIDVYRGHKARLFDPSMAKSGAINIDCEHGRRLVDGLGIPTITYGISPAADIRATYIATSASGIECVVDGLRIRSKLIGSFQGHNCLAAVAVARYLGISDRNIVDGIASVDRIPGRLELLGVIGGTKVILNDRHQPANFETALRTARAYTSRQLVAVVGCTDRWVASIAEQAGEVTGQLADRVVITNDGCTTDTVSRQLEAVARGVERVRGCAAIISDRRAALRETIDSASAGDLVIILGSKSSQRSAAVGSDIPLELALQTDPTDHKIIEDLVSKANEKSVSRN